MGWVFLGIVALPLAALAYLGFERIAPRLVEPVPEIGPGEPPGRRWTLGRRTTMGLRAGLVVALVAAVGISLVRQQKSSAGPAHGLSTAAAPAAAAPEVKLPQPAALNVLLRFGVDGAGEGLLHDPRDVAVDSAGNIYVADTGNHRVAKYKPDGAAAGQWTSSAKGKFLEVSSLVVAKDGIVAVDSEAGQLHKFDFNGKPVAGFEHDLGLSHPRGIAIDGAGTMYVADTAGNRIVKVAPDGSAAGDIGGLVQPTSVTVDDKGSLYIAEPDSRVLDKIAADGSRQARWAMPGSTTVLPPHLLWVAGRGLFMTAPNQNMILQYAPDGAIANAWAPVPTTDARPPERPLGLALAPGGKSLWVVWNGSSAATQLELP